ncbi:hypothetical protein [Kitasatospora camelliae]|uniref:Uncharacterized protein n=1 Tax=Kitasatospora camelliae TaxID=3156397 RepID=A0AAU8JTP9_9ACTN
MAAGLGALLAQLWGLALGVADAHAAAGEPGAGLVSRADAAIGTLAETAAPALEHPTAPVERLLQEQIRAGGLPLPGQQAPVPDAFAIAGSLLPSVPSQHRGEETARASRSGTPGVPDSADPAGIRGVPGVVVPAQRTPGGGAALPVTAERPVPRAVAAVVPAARPESAELPLTTSPFALTAATPAPAADTDCGTAVLAPITLGALLSGVALYRHRGLRRGH